MFDLCVVSFVISIRIYLCISIRIVRTSSNIQFKFKKQRFIESYILYSGMSERIVSDDKQVMFTW